jgi:DNA-binding NarL/FixJ family response regulator
MPTDPYPPAPPLSPRMRELIVLLAQGLTKKEAAKKMGISFHTVKGYLEETYIRLGVDNKADAIVSSIGLGIVVVEERIEGSM